MRVAFTTICVLVMFLAGGCATAPEKIAPSYKIEMSYDQWTCEHLAQEQTRLVAKLATAYEAQRKCRNNDIAGVILLGLPVSSLSGNNRESEVARLKGELQALQRVGISKNCSLPLVQMDQFKAKENPDIESKE